ncbi:hypothetical protein ACJD0Z_11495 [Flavobacteriaceae bacterium M23B6Z8]
MKTRLIYTTLMIIFCMYASHAQTDTTKVKKTTQKKEADNFMDLQSNVMTDILGSDLSGKPDGKKLNFIELLEKMELPPEQKEEWRNWYYLQSKEMTQKQKDSLGVALGKKLKEANKNVKN